MMVGNTAISNNAHLSMYKGAASLPATAQQYTTVSQNNLTVSEKLKDKYVDTGASAVSANNELATMQMAGGAMDEIQVALQKLVELAKQSAEGTYTDAERESMQQETEALLGEINRIASSASGNGVSLLDAGAEEKTDALTRNMLFTMAAYTDEAGPVDEPPATISNVQAILNEVSKPWGDSTGKIGAEWSAEIDPSNICDGSTITINGVTFEFDEDGSADDKTGLLYGLSGDGTESAVPDEGMPEKLVRVYIGNTSDTEGIVNAFKSAVEDNARLIAESVRAENQKWNEDVPKIPSSTDWEKSITFSWKKETGETGDTWKMSLTQSDDWAIDGDAFIVEAGSFVKPFDSDGYKWENKNEYLMYTDLDVRNIRDNLTFKIGTGDKVLQFRIKMSEDADECEEGFAIPAGGKSGTLYLKESLIADESRAEGSLAYSLTKLLNDHNVQSQLGLNKDGKTPGYVVTFIPKSDEVNKYQLSIMDMRRKVQPPKIDMYQAGILPGANNEENNPADAAQDGTRAYIEYEVDLDEKLLNDGDNFKFRGVRFAFDFDSDQSEPAKQGDEELVFINKNSTQNHSDAVLALRDAFNSRFAVSGGGIGKSAIRNNFNQAFDTALMMMKLGAFEMVVNFNDADASKATKATVRVYAKVEDYVNNVLDEDTHEIVMDREDEGWYTADELPQGEEGTDQIQEMVQSESYAAAARERFEDEAMKRDAAGEPVPLALESMTSEGLGIESIDIGTKEGAANAVYALSAALDKLTANRSALEEARGRLEMASEPAEADGSVSANTGINDVEDAQKTVKDVTEQIDQQPEDALKAQAGNVQMQDVKNVVLE